MTADSPGSVPRVLVVDDNRDAADSLCMILTMLGYEVQSMYTGTGVLDAALDFAPDCIVLDIGLPGSSGYEIAREIRRDERLRNARLIALTAYSNEAKARTAGFDHHLVKPIDPLVLKPIVEEVVGMKKRLAATERQIEQQGEIVADTRALISEIKDDIKEVKEELREVKKDVKELKDEVRKQE